MPYIRIDKAKQYYELAETQARIFSKDPSTKVGAILLAPESLQVLSLGYNGMPRGIAEKDARRWERPIKYRYVEHAERNALYNACRHGTPIEGAIAVVTMFPCTDCTRALIQCGVRCIVTKVPDLTCERWGADFAISLEMLQEANVECIYVEEQ